MYYSCNINNYASSVVKGNTISSLELCLVPMIMIMIMIIMVKVLLHDQHNKTHMRHCRFQSIFFELPYFARVGSGVLRSSAIPRLRSEIKRRWLLVMCTTLRDHLPCSRLVDSQVMGKPALRPAGEVDTLLLVGLSTYLVPT